MDYSAVESAVANILQKKLAKMPASISLKHQWCCLCITPRFIWGTRATYQLNRRAVAHFRPTEGKLLQSFGRDATAVPQLHWGLCTGQPYGLVWFSSAKTYCPRAVLRPTTSNLQLVPLALIKLTVQIASIRSHDRPEATPSCRVAYFNRAVSSLQVSSSILQVLSANFR